MKQKYALVGDPVDHSLSPFLFKHYAELFDCDLEYDLYPTNTSNLKTRINELKQKGYIGFNVTSPLKEAIFDICEDTTQRSHIGKAVNMVTFKNEKLVGDITDGVGLCEDLKNHFNTLAGLRVIVLGTGGVVPVILYELLKENVGFITIVGRTEQKVLRCLKLFQERKRLQGCLYHDLGHQPVDLIINATSAGLKGECPHIPEEFNPGTPLCYDLNYQKQAAPFLAWAKQQGYTTVDGFGMLLEQGCFAFKIWNQIF